MFLDELTPVLKELSQQPIAFLGGFFSGVFRLNLTDDPVKTWLDKQAGTTSFSSTTEVHNGKSGGPQSISIE
ncbi:hypothetical protein OsccyDRAFT_2976 [Leptolyngbyaceae cyanobacterium JSC-12]|nr:hypothetical protein OsccyDRAFT_2976 [Leptolyngbyaceae cyanobacterium JSC-12]